MTTEKERIKKIVKDEWDRLCLYEEVFGCDSESTKIQLHRWRALDELYTSVYDEEY